MGRFARVYSIVFGLTPESAREQIATPRNGTLREETPQTWLRIVLLQEFPVNQNLQLRIQEPCEWAKGGLERIRDCFNCWEQNNRLSKPATSLITHHNQVILSSNLYRPASMRERGSS